VQELLLSLTVFILFHLIPAIGPVRTRLISAVGKPGYIIGYSALSIAVLVWVSLAYGRADSDLVWVQQPWMRWVPIVALYFACVLLVGALTHPNPLSVGVKAAKFEPSQPGVVAITRHPLIWSFILWAGSHIVPNGDSASLVFFGLFLVLGLVGPKSLDLKQRRQLGEEEWLKLSGPTSNIPFLAILQRRTKFDWCNMLMVPGLGGLTLYCILFGAHTLVIGVSPFPQ